MGKTNQSNSNFDPLMLKNQLCFPIYACSREIVKKYKPYLDEIGLTYTQYITMMVLWEKKSINIKALGEHLYLDSGTLTPLLKKLEADGLVSRTRSQTDERNLVIELTEKGQALREQAIEIPQKIGSCIGLSAEDSMALYQLVYKLLDTIGGCKS